MCLQRSSTGHEVHGQAETDVVLVLPCSIVLKLLSYYFASMANGICWYMLTACAGVASICGGAVLCWEAGRVESASRDCSADFAALFVTNLLLDPRV